MENNNLNEMLEQTDSFMKVPKRGEIVKGKVVQVMDDEVVVNIGYKSDGIIPSREISSNPDINLREIINEGDELDVYVLKTDDGEGNVILSKKRVDIIKDWEELEQAYKENKTLTVNTKTVVKGGIIAYFKEIRGFIPASQLTNRYVENLDEFVNKQLDVKTIEVNKGKRKAVFSHRKIVEEKIAEQREKLWNTIEKDTVMKGEVKRLTNFGAFVDLGGVDGLIHISEMSWGHIKHPSEVLNVGDMVDVYIKDFNKDEGKISLSLKQIKGNPWDDIDKKYEVGQIIKGKVVKLVDFGAFVEIEPGIEGLLHISQISEKHISKPSEELEVGQTVTIKILDINKEEKRISLSIKEALESESVENYTDEIVKEEQTTTTIGDIIKFKENN
ncbi:MAG: hypothetical protein PWQ37_1857 [Candidatus Petromonas sp.]|jgi:ribosomal protein S1|nr:hypothetical protein [Candidatus Petromonas sp.]